jgi:mannose/cellobiose epimerase-like protein (N-acyl-D-glucosamine 2-epimerase family)
MKKMGLTVQLPLLGTVTEKSESPRAFRVRTRGGSTYNVLIKSTTWFDTVTNLDRLDRQRQPIQSTGGAAPAGAYAGPLESNVAVGDLIAVEGTYYEQGDDERYEAMTVHILKSYKNQYLFEHTHWWKAQIEAMANKWLDVLFGDKRTYAQDDFSALYRTTLNIEGAHTSDDTQEMATLSRLIYGLSSAYLLGGDERYFLAAKAGVEYQREAFRSFSTDGRFCFWLHARKRDRNGIYDVFPSVFDDDKNTLPLYEQIYALAGLAQFYRITNDRETLEDISKTLATFDALFADRQNGKHDGFFSHIDPVTFRWDSPELQATGNCARKNWNSVGDHLPAYLVNLILSLDPLPVVEGAEHSAFLQGLLQRSVEVLEATSRLILEKFPEKGNPYVNERFERDWRPVKDWRWQQDRGIVGHNLKIAWNLTRVANYYQSKGRKAEAESLFTLCRRIGEDMATLGVDQVRGGVYDAVERSPSDKSIPVQLAWQNTKDFWQQEQGILAYLIMYGHLGAAEPGAAPFLALAREISTVWNLYFLDRERNGIFFRISDNGIPVLKSTYGDKGGHSISGYHAFELAYLAHVYQLGYLPRAERQHTTFCLHFRPSVSSGLRSINVMPDFVGPGVLEVERAEVDGIPLPASSIQEFQVRLAPDQLGRHLTVYLRQTEAMFAASSRAATDKQRM